MSMYLSTIRNNVVKEGAGSVGSGSSDTEIDFSDVKDLSFDYEPTLEGAAAVDAFIEQEWLGLCEEQGLEELAYFEKNRKELPFDESGIDADKADDNGNDAGSEKKKEGESKGFKQKAIDFFNSVWNKIKLLGSKFLDLIVKFVGSDKQFIKRYEQKIKDADVSGIEFDGYNFTIDDEVSSLGTEVMSATFAKDASNEDILKQIRGLVSTGKESSLSAEEFNKEMFKRFRDGQTEKVKVKIDKQAIIDELKTGSYSKKATQEGIKIIKNSVNIFIADVKSNKALNRTDESTRSIRNDVAVCKMVLSVLQLANGQMLKAIKDRNRQAKAIAVKIVSASGKPADKKETPKEEGSLLFV